MFKKYMHLERYGTDAVGDIELGTCYIFPKLDGSNGSIWNEDGIMQCGSRNRVLSDLSDNAGFYAWATKQPNLQRLIEKYPSYTFYGEWLVPHSVKNYEDKAWKKFYIFDVLDGEGNLVPYDVYSEFLQEFDVDFIPCTTVVRNPSYEDLTKCVQLNTYLIKDGTGIGEGIVIKRYGFVNRYGNTVWAKLVSNSFKVKHVLAMGGNVISNSLLEEEIANTYVTQHLVDKIKDKIRIEYGHFSAKNIPQLLSTAYYDLVTEEMWSIVKTYKNPKIDFRLLYSFTTTRVKSLSPELFGISS